MKSWLTISRLLLVLALFGLVAAPMAVSSAAPAAAMAAASMPDGMPCCPDNQPAVPDCGKGCPPAVRCLSAAVSVSAPETAALLLLGLAGEKLLSGRDNVPASLAGEPPPRPPKA